MKCTVIEINTKTNEINIIECKNKKEAIKYIKGTKAELEEHDKKNYKFGMVGRNYKEEEEK